MILNTLVIVAKVLGVMMPGPEVEGLVATADRVPVPVSLQPRTDADTRLATAGIVGTPVEPKRVELAHPISVSAPSRPDPPSLSTELPADVLQDLVPGELPGLPAPGRDQPTTPSANIESLADDRVVLRLSSEPLGAAITVDGRPRGRTPAKLMLNPGRHRIEIRAGRRKAVINDVLTADREICLVEGPRSLRARSCQRR